MEVGWGGGWTQHGGPLTADVRTELVISLCGRKQSKYTPSFVLPNDRDIYRGHKLYSCECESPTLVEDN